MRTPSLLRLVILTALVVSVASVAGCYDPTADTDQVSGGQAKQEKQVNVAEEDLEFELNADNCDIKWTGSNQAGMTPHGFFYELSGRIVVDGADKKLKHFEVNLVMDSVKAMNESLTKKLKHNGFFEVDTYPQSKFVATSIMDPREGDKDHVNNVIEGNFQLRDTTKSIQIPVSFQIDPKTGNASLTSEFSLNRKDYGVVYENSVEDVLIRDNVLINIEIDAEPKK